LTAELETGGVQEPKWKDPEDWEGASQDTCLLVRGERSLKKVELLLAQFASLLTQPAPFLHWRSDGGTLGAPSMRGALAGAGLLYILTSCSESCPGSA
jgi:hypothetical protein